MSDAEAGRDKCIFTVGHSNHPEQVFLDLLKGQQVQVVVDVRSQPYSKYASQHNAEPLKHMLNAAGLKYVFLGKELGGRPQEDEFYDTEGHVLYDRVAQSKVFLEGIQRLVAGCTNYRVAIMCSEENPADCHRHLLVGRVLAGRGITLRHIRADGRLQTDAEVNQQSITGDSQQRLLFEELKERPWRSIRSVLPKRKPDSSSGN
jgi:uncharacterized protein (DUF488 family)